MEEDRKDNKLTKEEAKMLYYSFKGSLDDGFEDEDGPLITSILQKLEIQAQIPIIERIRYGDYIIPEDE